MFPCMRLKRLSPSNKIVAPEFQLEYERSRGKDLVMGMLERSHLLKIAHAYF